MHISQEPIALRRFPFNVFFCLCGRWIELGASESIHTLFPQIFAQIDPSPGCKRPTKFHLN